MLNNESVLMYARGEELLISLMNRGLGGAQSVPCWPNCRHSLRCLVGTNEAPKHQLAYIDRQVQTEYRRGRTHFASPALQKDSSCSIRERMHAVTLCQTPEKTSSAQGLTAALLSELNEF
jgi:hypothetical protein